MLVYGSILVVLCTNCQHVVSISGNSGSVAVNPSAELKAECICCGSGNSNLIACQIQAVCCAVAECTLGNLYLIPICGCKSVFLVIEVLLCGCTVCKHACKHILKLGVVCSGCGLTKHVVRILKYAVLVDCAVIANTVYLCICASIDYVSHLLCCKLGIIKDHVLYTVNCVGIVLCDLVVVSTNCVLSLRRGPNQKFNVCDVGFNCVLDVNVILEGQVAVRDTQLGGSSLCACSKCNCTDCCNDQCEREYQK